MISVVMPVFNAEKYLAQAIDSILNQTFQDFEFIIINDSPLFLYHAHKNSILKIPYQKSSALPLSEKQIEIEKKRKSY